MNELRLTARFERQARTTPDAVALVSGACRLTYRELDRQANRLAHRLRALGVGPEVLVALCAERSPELVVAILGVLKAGGAYLPLDPAYPRERLAYMIEDAKAPVILTQRSLRSTLPAEQATIVCLEDDVSTQPCSAPDVETSADDLAYCIYTSGSTGRPKGVLITHRNVSRLFDATDDRFAFGPDDVWTLFHSHAFDVSVWEIWGALLHGGRLVVVPYGVTRSPDQFYELLEREAVTVLCQTPSAFRQLMWAESSAREARTLRLRYVIFAGEKLETQMLRAWFDRHGDVVPQLVNMYGITETTVHATYRPMRMSDVGGPSLVGEPVSDLSIHLLDAQGSPVADGEAGEIHVAGPGLARGYLNRDALTAERFVIMNGERLYRSGDLARRCADGDLEYLGRIDAQVKIRGHRIELGEVETALYRHPAVRAAVVDVRMERLIAYVVSDGAAPSVSDIRDSLREYLPDYMMPAAFVLLDELPLTPNGKVDRRALPAPERARPRLRRPYRAPGTMAESTLAEVFCEVLDVAPVGVDDSFFELGGDSIRVIRMLASARERGLGLALEQVMETPTVGELATRAATVSAARTTRGRFSMISAEERTHLPEGVEDAYPLTALQAGMHFHSELRPAVGFYHDIFSYRLRLPLKVEQFEAVVQSLVDRHETLRTCFDFVSFGEPTQLVHRRVNGPSTHEDLRGLEPAEQDAALAAWIDREKRSPFDWHRAPLARFHAQQHSDRVFQLIVSFHHAILDGWSLAVLVTEFVEAYSASLKGMTPAIHPPRTCYRDYVALEREAVDTQASRRFWVDQLEGASPQILPRWPESFRTGAGEPQRGPACEIGAATLAGLRALAGEAGVPLRNVLLAAYFKLIQFMSGQNDVVSGVTLNGRPEERDGERALGMFLNVAPIRSRLESGTWLELVRHIREVERTTLSHRRYPLSAIQQQTGGRMLFEAAFNFVNWHVFEPLYGNADLGFEEGAYFEVNDFALMANFQLAAASDRLDFYFDYDPQKLAAAQITQINGYCAAILDAMAADPGAHFDRFSPLSARELQQRHQEWNGTRSDYPRDLCIHDIFEQAARQNPSAVALVCGDEKLSYGELDRRAESLAHGLRARGVVAESPIGVCAERSVELVVALLGILKAGGVYVPLDPSYPAERLALMMADTGLRWVLTGDGVGGNLQPDEFDVLPIEAVPVGNEPAAISRVAVGPDSLAYVMYTSGSTGTPKGVAVTHRGVVRLIFGLDGIDLDARQTLMHMSSISFDASTFELWGALLHGGRCVLLPERVPTPSQLGELIRRESVTTIWLTAALYNAVIDESPESLSGVKQLLTGGEALSVAHVRRGLALLPETTIINGYGPTENTTFTCCYPVPRNLDDDCKSIPIGRPIGNTQAYVLDSQLMPVPTGVVAELFIGGEGLARGYVNRPELSDEKFIEHAVAGGPRIRLYRSGDFVRHLLSGDIEFVGRRDYQVKVRGFRIELGEIEATLRKHWEVQDAVVVVRADHAGAQALVGYVVARPATTPSQASITGFLREKLPAYMQPGAIVLLPALPMDTHGKTDRAALPDPCSSREDREHRHVEPRTPTEEAVAWVWSTVLGLDQISVQDDFFGLGGHSLAASTIVSRLSHALQRDVSLRELFDHPTVEELAACIDSSG